MKRILLSILVGVFLTVLSFLFGGLFSGGGHSLVAINIFFPYSGIVGPSLKDTRWEFISMILLVAQFPVYALLIAYSRRRRNLVATVIPLVHTVAVVIALQVYESSKPRYGLLVPTVAIQQIVGRERSQLVSQRQFVGNVVVARRVNSDVRH
jgi:hypothetical protein